MTAITLAVGFAELVVFAMTEAAPISGGMGGARSSWLLVGALSGLVATGCGDQGALAALLSTSAPAMGPAGALGTRGVAAAGCDAA